MLTTHTADLGGLEGPGGSHVAGSWSFGLRDAVEGDRAFWEGLILSGAIFGTVMRHQAGSAQCDRLFHFVVPVR